MSSNPSSFFFHWSISSIDQWSLSFNLNREIPSMRYILPFFSFFIIVSRICSSNDFFFSFRSIYHRKVPPNVGVQKSTVVSCVTGKVLETGTKHNPLLLRSCFGPSGSIFAFSLLYMNKIEIIYHIKL